MIRKIPLNIPNILSLYRLLSFPVVIIIALMHYEKVFVILLCINLITDILDGLIARVFKMQTELGAKLDSIADFGMYIQAILGIFIFKAIDFTPHIFSFSVFIGMFALCNIFSLIKFHRLPSLHLYSWKMGGYIQGIFFFVLFVFGFYKYFYFFMIFWGITSFTEHLIVQIILKKMKSNAKGLYWVIYSHRKNTVQN